MQFRSVLGSLQVPVAGLGALVCVGALSLVLSLDPSSGPGDGFVEGLAVVFMYVAAWGGFVVAALGLAIPVNGGVGIDFNRYQRLLFVVAAALALVSAVSPLVFWAVVEAYGLSLGSAALAWVAVMGLAVVALVAGLGWRAGEAVVPRLR